MAFPSGGPVQILNQIVTRPDVTRVVDCWEALKSELSHITCNSTSKSSSLFLKALDFREGS